MSSKDTVLRALEIHVELVREENIIVQYVLWILRPTLGSRRMEEPTE